MAVVENVVPEGQAVDGMVLAAEKSTEKFKKKIQSQI
jgi:hypothetical protein